MSLIETRACVAETKRPLTFQRLPLALNRLVLSIGTFLAEVEPRPVPRRFLTESHVPVGQLVGFLRDAGRALPLKAQEGDRVGDICLRRQAQCRPA